ncbi:MAG TPA: FAD-dependent oxidoreductase [Aggregatilineales bacterium]|nr:FAD-dependent oxidoreductase [Aggregatilineales bacterium]
MKIGIIGGGIAGLTAAWLLQGHHEVTLFEKQDRLGGHADTVEVEQDGVVFPIDAGFEFFYDALFPRFNRLLALVGAQTRTYNASVTIYDTAHGRTTLIPPFNRQRILWSAYNPRALADLATFQSVILRSIPLIENEDPFITLEQHLNSLHLPRAFLRDFLYPFLLAEWCVELEEFKTFSAYNIMKYIVTARPRSIPPIITASEVIGGMQTYLSGLRRQLSLTRIILNADVAHLSHADKEYTVHDATSGNYECEHLILATNATQASTLLKPFSWTEKRRTELNRIVYFKTSIAVHGDPTLMPSNPDHWSVINTRFENTHSSNTIYKKWRSKYPIFRSWVTYDAEMPSPLYHLRTYDHPKVNGDYFLAQKNLKSQQGEDNLWLAGLYMYDIDCHESALLSAVKVVQKLDLQSENLRLLLE